MVSSVLASPVQSLPCSISCTLCQSPSTIPTTSATYSTNLHPSVPLADPVWGDSDSASFCVILKDAYDEIVHRRKNSFKVPLGNVGNSLVAEMSRLYSAFASGSTMEYVALMAAIVLPALVLQIPHRKSKVKEHIACLERRLKLWKEGDLDSHNKEGRTIQQRLPKFFPVPSETTLARQFSNLMFKGKTHAALDLLTCGVRGKVLLLYHIMETDESDKLSVREILWAKHPAGQHATPDSIIRCPPRSSSHCF